MTQYLNVYYNEMIVGQVTLDDTRRWIFKYDARWLNHAAAFPISLQLPLQDAAFEPDQAKAFFANLLPEGDVRHLIAKKLQVSEGNDFELLKRLGGECAGAMSVYPPDQLPQKGEGYKQLSPSDFDQLLDTINHRPLLLVDKKARLSLAGAQEKLPIYIKDGDLFFPENGAASTHILKPNMQHFEETVQNEAFCMMLAREMGLSVPDVDVLLSQKGRPAFLINRYDRQVSSDGLITRLHQEDFCQALGKMPDQKYQNEGGPTLLDCFELLERYSSNPAVDKKRLIEWSIFNFIIGNCDAHAKNISLLIATDGVWLAPFYDLISTVVYGDLSDRMAMKIGGHYERDTIFERHWERFAGEVDVKSDYVMKLVKKFYQEVPKVAESTAKTFCKKNGGEKIVTKIVNVIQKAARQL